MSTRLLVLSGSLRAESFNTRLAHYVVGRLPDGVVGEVQTLHALPPYDQDSDGPHAPPAVHEFRERMAAADGVFIATPEYNYALPGVVKNAIDWASRPLVPRSSLVGRPMQAAVATTSPTNGVRALMDLRRFWGQVHGLVVPGPDCVVNQAHTKFSVDGEVETLDAVSEKMVDLAVRCLLRVVHSGASEALQENWSDYLGVLRS
jgi:chromate reductase